MEVESSRSRSKVMRVFFHNDRNEISAQLLLSTCLVKEDLTASCIIHNHSVDLFFFAWVFPVFFVLPSHHFDESRCQGVRKTGDLRRCQGPSRCRAQGLGTDVTVTDSSSDPDSSLEGSERRGNQSAWLL